MLVVFGLWDSICVVVSVFKGVGDEWNLSFSGWSLILMVGLVPAIGHKIAMLIKIILRDRSSILRSILRVASFWSFVSSPTAICHRDKSVLSRPRSRWA